MVDRRQRDRLPARRHDPAARRRAAGPRPHRRQRRGPGRGRGPGAADHVVLAAFAVHSACVDPDRMLRLLRPLARHSALTATLITRLVPLAAADHARLRDAQALRGPAAAPATRAALARRLVAGSLDRAVDIAATLELRGYARGVPRRRRAPARLAPRLALRRRRRRDHRARGVGARLAGIGGVRRLSDDLDRRRPRDARARRSRCRCSSVVPYVGIGFGPRGQERVAEAAPIVRMGAFSYSLPGRGRAGARALELEVEPGEFVVLAGRSGSGKSSLLRACCGLVPHYHGGEVVRGARGVRPRRPRARPGRARRPRRPRRPGPRDPGRLGDRARRARAAARAARRARRRPAPARSRRSTLALAIEHLLERPTDTLSGGELQRVALAAALVLRPRAHPARRADLAARPGRGRRADRSAAPAQRGVGDDRLARRASARALPARPPTAWSRSSPARIAFDGDPRGYCEWALVADPEAGAPGGAPVLARRAGAGAGVGQGGAAQAGGARRSPARRSRRRRRSPGRRAATAGGGALDVRRLWVELDSGTGPREVLRGHRSRASGRASWSR